MASSLSHLVVLALLMCSVSCQNYYYWHLVNEDAPKKDIKNTGTTDINQLQALCNQDPNCKGFNSNGWLKYDVSEPVYTGDCDLYTKQTYPFPALVPNLVPWPQNIQYGQTTVGISGSFQFTASPSNDDLRDAFARYKELIFVHVTSSSMVQYYGATLPSLQVSVDDLNAPLKMYTDESYELNIPANGSQATLHSKTFYGALRGLETFSQLVTFNFTTRAYQVRVAPVTISDFPRFTHRGLLIDTSRHFEPIRTIRKVIDSLTYAKMNVLHWHISDYQSFPMYSKSEPKLWDGAYSYVEKFTDDDVAAVVEYARKRGVRVMAEFDVPGHAGSWCAGYPEICPSVTCNSPLNPATNTTFDVIAGLFADATGKEPGKGLFPDELLHLGGDEVDTTCWTKTPSIAQWMKQQGFTADDAYMYFVKRAHDIAIQYGRSPVNWEEVFNHFGTKLDKRSVIHIWLDHATLAKVVAAGYRGILSNQDVWYLDHLDTTWQQFYLNEPFQNINSPKEQALILGGEGCMWGETVDTSDIFQTIWPRNAAVAERLWSARQVNNTDEFLPRLEWFRCLLNRRDIAAAPTENPTARNAPPGPGGCLYQ